MSDEKNKVHELLDYRPSLRVLSVADNDAPAGTLRLCERCGDVIEMVHENVGWIHNDGHLEEVCGPDWEENILDTMRAAQSILKVALNKYRIGEKGDSECE